MNTTNRSTTGMFAVIASICGLAAGTAELVVGTSRWIGDKDDPTTLGWVTIALTLIVAVLAAVTMRRPTPVAQLAAGAGLLVAAAVGLTTAGVAWNPAAAAATISGVRAVSAARRRRPLRVLVAEVWPAALLVVLASIYVVFGVVAGGGIGAAGVLGALAVGVALALRRRSRRGAALVLVVGVVPFAGMAASTGVVPFTALLILTIGLPHTSGSDHEPRSRPTPSARAA